MGYGKSVRIYLSDGTASGLRHAEIVNWTGQAISCPRNRFSELASWAEVSRPGVYFLFGKDPETDKFITYIGESENVYTRLSSHIKNKEFWTECVTFTSKDENLTKSHIKYLESRFVSLAISAGRYILENKGEPQQSSLPRADSDSMEEFISHVKLLLGTLGHKLLEPLPTKESFADINDNEKSINGVKLTFTVKGLTSYGSPTDEGFVVFADSKVSKKINASTPGKINEIRASNVADGVLKEEEGCFILTRDILLSSSSYAASYVAGASRNGRDSWKSEKGQTLKALEELMLE